DTRDLSIGTRRRAPASCVQSLSRARRGHDLCCAARPGTRGGFDLLPDAFDVTDTTEGREGDAPLELDSRLHEASRLTDEGNWSEAFELLREMESDHAGSALLLAMMGTVASEMEARGLAYDYFRRSLAGQPTEPEVLILLGTGLARFDDPDAEGVLR